MLSFLSFPVPFRGEDLINEANQLAELEEGGGGRSRRRSFWWKKRRRRRRTKYADRVQSVCKRGICMVINIPTTNGGMQDGSSVGTHTGCTRVFCTFGVVLHARLVLSNKISASEISRKFIKDALSVGIVQ